MSTTDRQELIRSAITFLSDPKTQQAPLAQRIQFLEAKGLTPPEIEDALKQTGSGPSLHPSQVYQNRYSPTYPPPYGPALYPGVQPWDWRDYFITAVISGSIAYGAAALFKKFLLPHLRPPTATAYEEDRNALTAQFDAAEALLKEIQNETIAVRTAVEEQRQQVEKATSDVEAVVQDMRAGEEKTRQEMREIREEVDNIREMLPKMIEKNKDTQKQSLAELQQELKSLKALLLSRAGGPLANGASAPSPSLPSFTGRPSIPAWQLAESMAQGGDSPPTQSSLGASYTLPVMPRANGKVEGSDADNTA